MGAMKDLVSEICEMHSKGFKPLTIAALLQVSIDVVLEVVANYRKEYEHAFDNSLETE